MGYVYMLRCADGTLYVGSTKDLRRRLMQHRDGEGSEHTRTRLPVYLFWHAQYPTVAEAFTWEKRMQGWGHAKRLAFAEGGIDAIRGWSRRQRDKHSGR